MTTGGATTGLAPAAGLGTQREATAADYWELMKPRIMLLIVITTIGSLMVAADGWPGTALVAWTVLGMALVSGGSSAVNHWYDRDIDALMERTSDRPVASGRVSPGVALGLGLGLGAAGVALLAIQVHWLSALWALAGFLCYVLVYTVWLKRRTPQNIVIGGAAGAVPPLAAWAAVDGSVSATAVALFAIVFLWTRGSRTTPRGPRQGVPHVLLDEHEVPDRVRPRQRSQELHLVEGEHGTAPVDRPARRVEAVGDEQLEHRARDPTQVQSRPPSDSAPIEPVPPDAVRRRYVTSRMGSRRHARYGRPVVTSNSGCPPIDSAPRSIRRNHRSREPLVRLGHLPREMHERAGDRRRRRAPEHVDGDERLRGRAPATRSRPAATAPATRSRSRSRGRRRPRRVSARRRAGRRG